MELIRQRQIWKKGSSKSHLHCWISVYARNHGVRLTWSTLVTPTSLTRSRINAAQFLGAPLAFINEDWHKDWIKFNKQQWALLITTMTHWWSPTLVRVCGDKSVRGQLSKSADGQLVCNFSERMMLIANHQACGFS